MTFFLVDTTDNHFFINLVITNVRKKFQSLELRSINLVIPERKEKTSHFYLSRNSGNGGLSYKLKINVEIFNLNIT